MILFVASFVACAPRPPVAPGAPAGAEVGTPHPLEVEAVDPGGRWVVVCQARADTTGDGRIARWCEQHGCGGDALTTYVVVGEGAGEPVDLLLDASPDGGWLAAVVDGELVVIDGRDGRRFPVAGADLRTLPAFAGSDRIVFRRAGPRGDALVVRVLPDGPEADLPAPEGRWQVLPYPASPWALLLVDPAGTAGAPRPELRGCGVEGPSIEAWRSGPDAEERWVDLDRGVWADAVGVVGAAGPELVRVTPGGGLSIGEARVLPAGCDPVVHATFPDPPSAIVACAEPGSTLNLVRTGPARGCRGDRSTEVTDLAVEPPSLGPLPDPWALPPGARVACVAGVCVDLASGAVVRAWSDGEVPLHHHHDRVLLARRGAAGAPGELVVLDASGGETALPGPAGALAAASGAVVVTGRVVVDLSSTAVLGEVGGHGEIVAVDPAGRVLTVLGETGPARWITPRAASP